MLLLLWLSALAYLVMQIFLLVRPLGGKRGAIALPLVVMVPVFASTIAGVVQQSNLWPLLLLLTSPLAFLYLLVVALVRLNARQ